ncbi:YSIRK-type signal peptide-containing protein [Staphylococcus haemolyticus]|uniref:YSIRK-type signal peptide-containing protein n=1 Tax=Staphylococcus haemolyticus TaxID=1283 RepID=UPI001F0B5CED|nr:YSIRK-type signal peptide-containing protein [Staphylococcus haemolyticus]MCH4390704.1 YSIRK-type signal peptide-containing protein [Staphylococcus haemolyticus]
MQQKTKYRFSIRKFSIGTVSILLDAFLFMDFQDVTHASGLHNSTSTTDTASNQQSFEKKVNNSTHEDVQNAALPSQSIPLKNLENTTKTETQPQTTSKTTHSGNENVNAQTIAASSQLEKTTTHTCSRRSATSAIASEGVLEDTTTTATPNMDNANGTSVKSRDVVTPQPKDSNTTPTPNVVFEKSTDPNQFTFEITDLKEFNATYQTKYYYRLSKPFDDSNDVTIKLVNGETNSVVETKQINSPGTVSIGENSLERAVAARDPQKAKYGYINFTFIKENKINKLGITDDYDETSVVVQSIKVYDGITGQDVTNLFDIIDENGIITLHLKKV